jgi:hypothetical protein
VAGRQPQANPIGKIVARKADIKQIEAIARKFRMSPEQRREFGDYVEALKAAGHSGTKNDRGDFTYAELEELAREFVGG